MVGVQSRLKSVPLPSMVVSTFPLPQVLFLLLLLRGKGNVVIFSLSELIMFTHRTKKLNEGERHTMSRTIIFRNLNFINFMLTYYIRTCTHTYKVVVQVGSKWATTWVNHGSVCSCQGLPTNTRNVLYYCDSGRINQERWLT